MRSPTWSVRLRRGDRFGRSAVPCHQTAFERDRRLDDARRRHHARRLRVQLNHFQFADVGRKTLTTTVHPFRHRFVTDVHDELAGRIDVHRRVLQFAVREPVLTIGIGGSSSSMQNILNGAALTTPFTPTVVMSAIDRGTIRLAIGL
jgi:hypothetical protein